MSIKTLVITNNDANKRIKGYLANINSQKEAVYTFVGGYVLGIHANLWTKNDDVRVAPRHFRTVTNIGGLISIYSSSGFIKSKILLVDNPLFTLNGHDDKDSPKTRQHLLNQGSPISLKSAAYSMLPAQAAVACKAVEGGLSIVRLQQLQAKAKRMTGSTVGDWLGVIVQMARQQRNAKGMDFAASAVGCFIPCGDVLSVAVQLCKSVGAAREFICIATALELHWRAFLEQLHGSDGPASRILWELFLHLGAGRVATKGEVRSFIKEPAGWLPVKNALLTI